MYSYIIKELMALLATDASRLDCSRASICGHSMGGHGALTIGLKNGETFKSISAFSPICHPSDCPWGVKGAPRSSSATAFRLSVVLTECCSDCVLFSLSDVLTE